MLRSVAANAALEFRMVGARCLISAWAFVSPGAVGFGSASGPNDVSPPATDSVIFHARWNDVLFDHGGH